MSQDQVENILQGLAEMARSGRFAEERGRNDGEEVEEAAATGKLPGGGGGGGGGGASTSTYHLINHGAAPARGPHASKSSHVLGCKRYEDRTGDAGNEQEQTKEKQKERK